MKIYFVRHGHSVLTENRYQRPEDHLSELGKKQAAAVAARFAHIDLDLIVTSLYTRALQTAQEIAKVNSIPLIQNELFVERKFPSSFLGKSTSDPDVIPLHQTMRAHFYEPDWHYEDEENFTELLHRAKAAFAFIRSQKKENIMVVTHGYFLNVALFHLIFGEKVDFYLFNHFRDHVTNNNTGVTICEYKEGTWTLVTWNDYSHLEEK